MAKTRSPRYPAIGLKEAVEKVTAIYRKDYQNPLPRSIAVEHMGYASLNGKSLGVLSALLKFGLLEGRGDDTRVSDAAVTIIAHPPGSAERVEALRGVARLPDLFGELDNRFQGGKASDQAIRSYLMTQKYIPSAADTVIRAYRETKQLVEDEARGYLEESAVGPASDASTPMPSSVQTTPQPRPYNPAVHQGGIVAPPSVAASPEPSAEPFQMGIFGRYISLTARLETPEQIDELVRRLQFAKLMIAPLADIKRPSDPVDIARHEEEARQLNRDAAEKE